MVRLAEARIYTSELALLYQLVAESPDLETGGELLGLWSHQGSPTIMLVTGPDTSATRTETHFLQPPDTHMRIERHMWDTFGLQVLGIWHSHHLLGLHELSHGDRQRTQRYASNHGRLRYLEFLGYLDEAEAGQPRIRPYLYSDAPELTEVPIEVVELPGMSPTRDALRRNPPPTGLHTSLLLGAPPVTWAGGFGVATSIDRSGEDEEEADIEAAPDGDASGEPATFDLDLVSEAGLSRPLEDEAPDVLDELAQHRADAGVDIVLALETALARLPVGSTRLVRLSIEDSDMELSIEAQGHRAKLLLRITSPREVQYRWKATAYPVVYTADDHQELADFYYERLVDAIGGAAEAPALDGEAQAR
jgi:hypothetical protein